MAMSDNDKASLIALKARKAAIEKAAKPYRDKLAAARKPVDEATAKYMALKDELMPKIHAAEGVVYDEAGVLMQNELHTVSRALNKIIANGGLEAAQLAAAKE